MSVALQSLSFTTLQKPSTNPTLDRRARIIARREGQKLLLGEPSYQRTIRPWAKNEAAGSHWSKPSSVFYLSTPYSQ
jgi:hypothetical protein